MPTKTTSAKPILNYTTQIEAAKTVGEIQALLVTKGARSVAVDYDDDGQPDAIVFALCTETLGSVQFRFTPNVAGVLRSMNDDPKIPWSKCTIEQAARVAWRIEKSWLEAQFAKLDAMRMPLEQIMLPYLDMGGGKTLYDGMREKHLALTEGN